MSKRYSNPAYSPPPPAAIQRAIPIDEQAEAPETDRYEVHVETIDGKKLQAGVVFGVAAARAMLDVTVAQGFVTQGDGGLVAYPAQRIALARAILRK